MLRYLPCERGTSAILVRDNLRKRAEYGFGEQTLNSVSFFALTKLRGESSVSSSQPAISVTRRTHRVFRRTHRVCPKTQRGSVSSLLRNSALETVFRLFPKYELLQKLTCPHNFLSTKFGSPTPTPPHEQGSRKGKLWNCLGKS